MFFLRHFTTLPAPPCRCRRNRTRPCDVPLQVGQSFFTSFWTTLWACFHALYIVFRERPQVVWQTPTFLRNELKRALLLERPYVMMPALSKRDHVIPRLPQLLCNGPGTCVPLVGAATLMRIVRQHGTPGPLTRHPPAFSGLISDACPLPPPPPPAAARAGAVRGCVRREHRQGAEALAHGADFLPGAPRRRLLRAVGGAGEDAAEGAVPWEAHVGRRRDAHARQQQQACCTCCGHRRRGEGLAACGGHLYVCVSAAPPRSARRRSPPA